MDPILAQSAGLAIEEAYRLGKTIQDSPLLGTYLNTQDRNSALDFDELMPALIEFEDHRWLFHSLSLSQTPLKVFPLSKPQKTHLCGERSP
jgi:hypothetical protein